MDPWTAEPLPLFGFAMYHHPMKPQSPQPLQKRNSQWYTTLALTMSIIAALAVASVVLIGIAGTALMEPGNSTDSSGLVTVSALLAGAVGVPMAGLSLMSAVLFLVFHIVNRRSDHIPLYKIILIYAVNGLLLIAFVSFIIWYVALLNRA